MKKLIYCALALSAGLFASSCQQENLEPVQQGNTVTFTVEIPEVATKAIGEANDVDNLVYAVYRVKNDAFNDEEAKSNLANVLEDGNDDYQLVYQEDTPIIDMKANVTLELINDQRYVVIFWAQHGYTWFTKESQFVKVDYPENFRDPNNDARDAFTNVSVIRVNSSISKDITLVRPFAQLNIATTLPDTSRYPNFSVDNTTVKVTGLASSFNVGAQVGKVKEGTVYEVNYAAVVPIDDTFGDYEAYLSMNYVFVPDNRATVKVSYDIVTNDYGTVSNQISNVPVARNYKTNIIGELLTSDVKYNVELENWYTNDNSGTTEVICDGLVKNQYGDYEVSTENGLAYAMNNLFKENANYYLTKEVYDLSGFAVTPPVVPTGVTINIYGETPVVTRAATTFAGITIIGLPVVDGTPTLIAEVENGGSVSVSGVTLDDEGSVLVENNQGTLVVTETEVKSDSYVGEGSNEPVQADSVSTLKDLQTSLASGVKQINLASPITIPAGDEVVINLNGKTVIGVDDYETGSYGLITNNGTLIVEGPGTIQLTATYDRDWSAYSSVISNQPGGNLTVKDGAIIEHLGGSDMAYGIDNLTNGRGTSAVTTIKNATVKSVYRAVRQFLNGVEATNELYVEAGAVIEGTNKSVWMQDPSANPNTGTLVVAEGAQLKGDVYLYVCEGSTEWPVEVSIAKSALVDGSEIQTNNIPELYSVVDENGFWTVKTNAAKVGEVKYLSFVEAVAAAKAGDTITLLSDVTLATELKLPADVTLNGNGKQINGTVVAGGNLTFAGHTKVTAFGAGYYDRVITIGEGACLEVTGTGRVSLAYRNTFNITGNVEDAKNADKANIQPSLIIPGGISITGGSGATMNVENAYVVLGSTSSKDNSADGTFNLNFTNSIAEFTNQFTFSEPANGKTPTFNVNVTDGVLTTGTKMIAAAPGCNIKLDNSNVTLATYFRNSGKFDVVNGSVLTGSTIQFGENGGNDGALTVDASTVTISASSKGHALDGKGTGSITLKNAAVVTIDYVKDMILAVADDCTFTCKELLGNCSNRTVVADGVTKDENGAYYVSSAAGLKKMNEMFDDKSAGKNAVMNLVADIDFTGYTWTNVDSHADTNFWISEINGNGHTISNLTINGQAMFRRFAGSGDVTIKDITFDNATVNSNGSINTSILTVHSYQNVLLDNVDVKNSSITGGYKVAPLIATVYNEGASTITATLKNCDVTNTTVKATSYDFCTTGMVAFVYEDDNDHILFENCSVKNVKLYAPNVYQAHAAVYTAGSDTLYNEVEGVTVENVTFENI